MLKRPRFYSQSGANAWRTNTPVSNQTQKHRLHGSSNNEDKLHAYQVLKSENNKLQNQHVQLRTQYRVLEKDLLARYADIEDLHTELTKVLNFHQTGLVG